MWKDTNIMQPDSVAVDSGSIPTVVVPDTSTASEIVPENIVVASDSARSDSGAIPASNVESTVMDSAPVETPVFIVEQPFIEPVLNVPAVADSVPRLPLPESPVIYRLDETAPFDVQDLYHFVIKDSTNVFLPDYGAFKGVAPKAGISESVLPGDTLSVADSTGINPPDTIAFTQIDTVSAAIDSVLTTTTEVPKERAVQSQAWKSFSLDWMVGVLIVSLIILAWIRIFFNKYLSAVSRAAYSYTASFKLFQSKNSISQRVSAVANFLFIMNLAMFLFQLTMYFGVDVFPYLPFVNYIIFTGIILLIYLLKSLVYQIVGFVFNAEQAAGDYIHNVFIYNKILGLALLPVIIGIPYVPETLTPVLVKIGIVLVAISLLFRILRGIQISIKAGLSIFYLILYLCTLEILPALMVYKVLNMLIFSNVN